MKVYENPRMQDWAIAQVGKKMLINQARTGPFHASEVYSCFRKVWYNRTDPHVYDSETILKFAVGFAVQEWFFGAEDEGQEINGVIFSPDRIVQDNVLEFKTTRRSPEVYQKDGTKYLKDLPKIQFDVEKNETWIDRTGAYCAEFGLNKAHILVFFLFQNQLRAYTLEFTDQELESIRADVEEKRVALTAVFKKKKEPPVSTRTGDWECDLCPYADKCRTALVKDGWVAPDDRSHD